MLLADIFGSDALIVIVIALIVIFGGSQLPKIARNVGSAGKEFKKALGGDLTIDNPPYEKFTRVRWERAA